MKYPLILAHGVAAKDNSLFWGRIPSVLRKNGINVFSGNTDSFGNINSNALALKATVDFVLETYNAEKVNIIAHSKGGIDARFLISSMGYGERIASLTTMCTPHRGSEIVDYIFDLKYLHSPFFKRIVNLLIKLYGDKSPDPYAVIKELTTGSMSAFNSSNPDDPRVYYSSYGTRMKNKYDDLSYFLTNAFIAKVAGDNDGIVSINSARWGAYFEIVSGVNSGISHAEMVDVKRKKISGIDIPQEYVKIVRSLSQKGF